MCKKNKLSEFPPEITLLKKILSFECYQTQIKRLPDDFSVLCTVEFNGNELDELPESFVKLQKVHILRITFNNFVIMPP